MIAGPVAHDHDVIVVVDNAGHHGALTKIDDPSARSWTRSRATNRGNQQYENPSNNAQQNSQTYSLNKT